MSRGKVTAIKNSYGFIRGEDGVPYFFHLADLTDAFDVKLGDEVTFDVEVPAPTKGPRARAVSFAAGARS